SEPRHAPLRRRRRLSPPRARPLPRRGDGRRHHLDRVRGPGPGQLGGQGQTPSGGAWPCWGRGGWGGGGKTRHPGQGAEPGAGGWKEDEEEEAGRRRRGRRQEEEEGGPVGGPRWRR